MASIEVESVANPPSITRLWPQLAPLWVVFSWELSRLLMGRLIWLSSGGVVAFTALIMWQMKVPARLQSSLTHTTASLSINSPWGLLLVLPSPLLFLFAILLPFIFTSQLSRELKQRTHELVMTCSTPGWAFVMGRYLAGLVVSLAMALLLLCSMLATGLALQLWDGQPDVPLGPAVALWAIIMLPAIFLISGLSAGLAAWQPHRAGLIIALLLLLWCMSPQFLKLPPYTTPWYATWDPTATLMSGVLDRQYRDAYYSTTRFVLQNEVVQQVARRLEQNMPDLWPWLLPRLLFSVLGVGSVGIAAWRFKRFANCLR